MQYLYYIRFLVYFMLILQCGYGSISYEQIQKFSVGFLNIFMSWCYCTIIVVAADIKLLWRLGGLYGKLKIICSMLEENGFRKS